ncbi:hypothetical protein HDU87_008686 [Geranomyces variabilis]|uniref:Uncharacterized protein n=1 Tax=Geranomyces variabilis TaxID=109894 RepID=A0AAD5XM08_9FUNG|nr:hypothetical protein HDU87_008686 [Geranomyces variabilis]
MPASPEVAPATAAAKLSFSPVSAPRPSHLSLHLTAEQIPDDLRGFLANPLFDATLTAGSVDKADAVSRTTAALKQVQAVWQVGTLEWSELAAVLHCLGFPMHKEDSPNAIAASFPQSEIPTTLSTAVVATGPSPLPPISLPEIAQHAHRSTRRLSELLFSLLYVRGRALSTAYRAKVSAHQSEATQVSQLKAEIERLKRKLIDRSSKADDDRRRRVLAENALSDLTAERVMDGSGDHSRRRCFVGSKSFDIQRAPRGAIADSTTTPRTSVEAVGAAVGAEPQTQAPHEAARRPPLPQPRATTLATRRSIFRKSWDHDTALKMHNQLHKKSLEIAPLGPVLGDLAFPAAATSRQTANVHGLGNSALDGAKPSASSAGSTATITASSSAGSDSCKTTSSSGSPSADRSTSGRSNSAAQTKAQSGRVFSSIFESKKPPVPQASGPQDQPALKKPQATEQQQRPGLGRRLSRLFGFSKRKPSLQSLTDKPPAGPPLDARSRPVILAPANSEPAAKPDLRRPSPVHHHTAPGRVLRDSAGLRPPVPEARKSARGPSTDRRGDTPSSSASPEAGNGTHQHPTAPVVRNQRSRPKLTSDDMPLQVIRDRHLKSLRRRTYHGQIAFMSFSPPVMRPADGTPAQPPSPKRAPHQYEPQYHHHHQPTSSHPRSRNTSGGSGGRVHGRSSPPRRGIPYPLQQQEQQIRRHSWGPNLLYPRHFTPPPPQLATHQLQPQQQHVPHPHQYAPYAGGPHQPLPAPTPLVAFPGDEGTYRPQQ